MIDNAVESLAHIFEGVSGSSFHNTNTSVHKTFLETISWLIDEVLEACAHCVKEVCWIAQ